MVEIISVCRWLTVRVVRVNKWLDAGYGSFLYKHVLP